MTCRYCGARNSEDEHRCQRCGRRLVSATAQAGPNPYPVCRTSPVPNLVPRPEPEATAASSDPGGRPIAVPRQASLFPNSVIRFEDIDPRPKTRRRTTRRRPVSAASARSSRRSAPGAGVASDQQSLDFPAPAPPDRQVTRSGVEPARYCEHPVAQPVHRLMAAGLDLSMIGLAVGVFLALLHFGGGRVVLNSTTTPIYVGAACAIGGFYRVLWWLAGADTPGMLWSRLRLLDFDGRPPTRRQRAHRFAGACLSLASAGLGLMWALGDEEKLAWHDHISRTFPSPRL